MAQIQPITNDAEYERAQARLMSVVGTPLRDADTEEELRLLAEELERYSREHFGIWKVRTDGVHHLEFRLDQGMSTLEELERVFGGRARLVNYMTRRNNLNAATLEALVKECNIDRERIDKPFCKPAGWQDIALADEEPCDDPICCNPDDRDWRAELLAGINRDGQDVEDRGGDLVLSYPAHR